MKTIRQYIREAQQFIHEFVQNQRYKPGAKSFTFMFFLFFSTILWFLTTLSLKYTDVVNYPVRYTNFPENYTLLGKTTSALQLQVEALGYTLLFYKMAPLVVPVEIDFKNSQVRNKPGADSLGYFLPTSTLLENIAKQLGNEVVLLKIKPDTISFDLTPVIKRRLPVRLRYASVLPKPFRVSRTPSITPDSVTVVGPGNILAKIDAIYTEKLIFEDIENTDRTADLELVQGLTFKQRWVRISKPIEKYTEGQISVPLRVINCPDSISLKPFPPHVQLSYVVNLQNFRKVKPQAFDIYVDYFDIQRSISKRIPVHLVKFPEFIDLQIISPRKVEYILENKE